MQINKETLLWSENIYNDMVNYNDQDYETIYNNREKALQVLEINIDHQASKAYILAANKRLNELLN